MDTPAPPTTERPPSGDEPQGPRVTRDEVKDLGRLRRSLTDRHVGGVAGGLARHLDVDPIIVRVSFVVAVFLGGAGLLAYGAAWILVPEEGTPDRPLGLDDRSRSAALAAVGIVAVFAALADWVDAYWFPWPVALVVLGVMWFLNRKGSSRRQDHDAVPYPSAAPTSYDMDLTPPPGAAAASYARPMPPRKPRKRGPVLFWFTLALIALAEGVLGVVDVAGVDVLPSAYPALALGIIAAMLLLGAFWGRAGGLILLGAVVALATVVTSAASSWEEQRIRHSPTEAAEVRGSYELEEGDLVLDLSGIDDVEELDGRTIHVDGGVGRIEVIVPDGVDVQVTTDVGVGEASLFRQRSGGLGTTLEGSLDGGSDVPDVDITIDLGVGEVVVREN